MSRTAHCTSVVVGIVAALTSAQCDGSSAGPSSDGAIADGADPDGPTEGTSFADRCTAPGVVLCNGLDLESDIASGMQQAADGTRQGFIDPTIKTSGAGSLKFTLRAGVHVSNIGGAWSGDLGKDFAAGDTIYVQWRQRVSPEYLSNNLSYWDSSIKQINIHGPSSTCQAAEFTTITGPRAANLPSMYTACGIGFDTHAETNVLCDLTNDCNDNGPLLQQGSSLTPSPDGSGYNCNYQDQVPGDGLGTGCFFPAADTWYTYYEKIVIGAKGTRTSSVEAYVAVDGGPYKQWQRADQILFAEGGDDHFSVIRLETYMTELPLHAPSPVDAYVWYDELIVSTQPIALPAM